MARSPHEPRAKVMPASEVWEDARRLGKVLRANAQRAEPQVQIQVPLSAFLAALDGLSLDQLLVLRQRLDERLVSVQVVAAGSSDGCG